MATLDELSTALRNADAAGDTDAARSLANEIVRVRAAPSATAQEPPTQTPSTAAPSSGPGFFKTVDDYVRAGANGLTFGLADRFAAGMGAVTGVGGNAGDYAGNLNTEQQKTDQFSAEHPIGSAAANIAGSAIVPMGALGAAAKGATLGTKMLYGAGAGLMLGGAQGALGSKDYTDLPDVGKNAVTGAVVGGGLGMGMPAAGRVIGSGYNKIVDALTGKASGISRSATEHLVSAAVADDPNRLKLTVNALGPDAMLADSGPAMLGKAQGASLNSDEARSTLVNALTGRNQGTNARIAGDVNRALGPAEDPQTVTNAIRATRSATDEQNYGRALGPGAPQVDTSGVLADLGPRIGQSVGMENRALGNLREMMMTDRQFPVMDPVTGRQMVANGIPVTEMRRVPQDDPQVLHKIKGELDNVIQYDAPGLGVPAAALSNQQGALRLMRGRLNEALEQQVPGYAEANQASAGLARRGEAVEHGTQYLGGGKTTPSPDRFATEFAQREPGEQIAFAKGSRGNIDRLLGTKANDLQALRSELQGEGGWNTSKLATVHGQDAADDLVNSVDRNLKFRDTYNKVVENSQTAQRTAASNAMKPVPPGEVPIFNPNMTFPGLLAASGKKVLKFGADAVRPDPTASYGEVARVLSAQGAQRDQHLQAIIDAITRRHGNAALAPQVGDKAALIAAILGNDYAHNGPRRSQD